MSLIYFGKKKIVEFLILIGQAICLLLIMHTHLYANIMQWMSSECIHLKVFIDISSSSQTRNYQNTSLLRHLEKPSPLDSNPSTAKHVYISSAFVYIWAYIYLPSSVFLFTFSRPHFPKGPPTDHVSLLPDGVCIYNMGATYPFPLSPL